MLGQPADQAKKSLPQLFLEQAQIVPGFDGGKASPSLCFLPGCQVEQLLMDVDRSGGRNGATAGDYPGRGQGAGLNELATGPGTHDVFLKWAGSQGLGADQIGTCRERACQAVARPSPSRTIASAAWGIAQVVAQEQVATGNGLVFLRYTESAVLREADVQSFSVSAAAPAILDSTAVSVSTRRGRCVCRGGGKASSQ